MRASARGKPGNTVGPSWEGRSTSPTVMPLPLRTTAAFDPTNSHSRDRALDAAELGERFLSKTEDTVWADLARAPDRLPPPIRIPGTRKALWLESTVVAWLQAHQVSAATAAPKRGRPTKREQIERIERAARAAAAAAPGSAA